MNIVSKIQAKRIEKVYKRHLSEYVGKNAEELKTAQSTLQSLRAELASKCKKSAILPNALQKTIWDIDDTLIMLNIFLKYNY